MYWQMRELSPIETELLTKTVPVWATAEGRSANFTVKLTRTSPDRATWHATSDEPVRVNKSGRVETLILHGEVVRGKEEPQPARHFTFKGKYGREAITDAQIAYLAPLAENLTETATRLTEAMLVDSPEYDALSASWTESVRAAYAVLLREFEKARMEVIDAALRSGTWANGDRDEYGARSTGALSIYEKRAAMIEAKIDWTEELLRPLVGGFVDVGRIKAEALHDLYVRSEEARARWDAERQALRPKK